MAVVQKLTRGETTEIPGVLVDDHTFIGAVSVITLMKRIARDPMKVEDKKMRDADPELQQAYELRKLAQRVMEAGKERNVAPYAHYLTDLHQGADGAVPAIHLWIKDDLPVLINLTDWGADEKTGHGGHAVLGIPVDTIAMAIDGDTQLAARFKAYADSPATGSDRVPLMVHFNRSVTWAQNAFHDLNVLGVSVNAAISIGMDNRDPFTAIAKSMEMECESLKGYVNTTSRSVKRHEKAIITMPALRHFALGVAFGTKGQSYGNKPVPHEDYRQADLHVIEETAKIWWTALFARIGDAIKDREHTVASSLPAIIALGALGNELLKYQNVAAREREAAALAAKMALVQWKKGPRWEGVLGGMAGDKQGQMRFQIRDQGASRIACYAALSDPNSAAYERIRQADEPSAVAAE